MSEPLRVLHVTGSMNLGGQETLIMELYRHMNRSLVQFDFLLYDHGGPKGAYDDEILALGGNIFYSHKKFFKNPILYVMEQRKFFTSHPYSVVHAHLYKMSGFALQSAKQAGTNVTIAHSHIANTGNGHRSLSNSLREIANEWGQSRIHRYADYCFGCSKDALKEFCLGGAQLRSSYVIRNAINLEKFMHNEDNRKRWRGRLGADKDTIVVGNVARFNYQKNHEKIIETFAQIKRMHSDSVLVLVGVGSELEKIRLLAKQLGLIDSVFFMGSRKDVNEIINAFDVFLMPSRYEGLGIVLIEAQANGLTCVASSDVIPEEADIGAGIMRRFSLDEPPEIWAKACIAAAQSGRLSREEATAAVCAAGYDIAGVASWLQDFYLEHAQ